MPKKEENASYQTTRGMGAMSAKTEQMGQEASSDLSAQLSATGMGGVKLKEFAAMGLAAWLFGARTKRKWGFDEALSHWEREGKQKGDPEAARYVGLCYQLGHGCIKDEKQAFNWYLRGAMHGDVLSARFVGSMYERGEGCEVDDEEAMSWFQRAAEGGDIEALRSIGSMIDEGRGAPYDHNEARRHFRAAAMGINFYARDEKSRIAALKLS